MYTSGTRARRYPETHWNGHISVENIKIIFENNALPESLHIEGDLGIQISDDGRVWVCVNGIAFIRFKPSEIEQRRVNQDDAHV